ncbi:WD repeat and FYVE domain-containing protein 3 [Rhizoctonia solani]|uniref:WD repeat and FYVE domain-containing protein 3 n=1 Tax=Rhizoctonia solani TaxID=456999 RepID=A0A0K6FKU3_9AGAM|nr:WD repeat and FYVE domain-containing protein 3 [Rhizoctonia solani]
MHIKASKSHQKKINQKKSIEIDSLTSAQHGSHLLQLPSELLTHLTAYLDPIALTTLASVCRLFLSHINQDGTWRAAFLCHFLGISPGPNFITDDARLVLLRRGENSWRAEFQKHWVLARRWEKTRSVTSVTHRPHRTPITAVHVMQSQRNAANAQHSWAILSASLATGAVTRSYPFTGKVVRGHFDASSVTTALGLGMNPNFEEAFSIVSSLALASTGGTGIVVWGLRSGGVAVTIALRAMEAGCNARMIKCSVGDAHRMAVEDILVENSINGSECIVSGSTDGSVKLWNLPTTHRGQLNCIWTGEYTDNGGLASEVPALVKVPCVKVAIDLTSEVVAAGYADGAVLVWFGVTLGSSDSSDIKCVRIPPPSTDPLPLATLRIHGHSQNSASVLAHYTNDAHFYRLRVEKDGGLVGRFRFGGGPLAPLGIITTRFVKQNKESARTGASSAIPSTLISASSTPAQTIPSTPVPTDSSQPVSGPIQIKLDLPKHDLISAQRSRSFVSAGDALGRVCVWDWDAEETLGQNTMSKSTISLDESKVGITTPERNSARTEPVPEVQAAVVWDAMDGEAISALAWGDVTVAVGSTQGNTAVFDSLSQQLLRRIPSPVPTSAIGREPVSQLVVEGDTVLISVGPQIVAWQVRKDSGKGDPWAKSPKGKQSANGKGRGTTVAKWQHRNELNSEISHSLNQMKDEHARTQPGLRRARAQAGALAEMGLDEADAVQYLMMLSRDEEEARRANESVIRESEAGSSETRDEEPYGSPTNSTRSSVPSASTSPSSRRSGRSVYIPASRRPRIDTNDIPDDNPYLGTTSGRSPHQGSSSYGGGSRYGGSQGEFDEDEALRLALELSMVEQ